MNLVVKELASLSIARAGIIVEADNTEGSGARWIRKVYENLEDQAKVGAKYALCQNQKLAVRNYHCFTYNNTWVVAYRIVGNDFVVYRFIYGPHLR